MVLDTEHFAKSKNDWRRLKMTNIPPWLKDIENPYKKINTNMGGIGGSGSEPIQWAVWQECYDTICKAYEENIITITSDIIDELNAIMTDYNEKEIRALIEKLKSNQ